MRKLFSVVTCGLAAAALLAATPARAASFTLNVAGMANDTGNAMGTSIVVYNSGGLTVTATAWMFNTGTGKFEQAAPDIYNGFGMGVCNAGEGQFCSSPNHQIDNDPSSHTDFVLFTFNQAVDPTNVHIATFSDGDLDTSYWVGTPPSMNGATLGSSPTFALSGMGNIFNDDCSGSCSLTSRDVGIGGSSSVTGLLFGARLDGTGDSYRDYFKIQSLSFTTSDRGITTVTPEPGSMILLGTGLAGLALAVRRRVKK